MELCPIRTFLLLSWVCLILFVPADSDYFVIAISEFKLPLLVQAYTLKPLENWMASEHASAKTYFGCKKPLHKLVPTSTVIINDIILCFYFE